MVSDLPRVRYLGRRYSSRTYYVLMKTLQTTLACEASDIAQYRYHVLCHFYRYGIQSTLDAFRLSRTTVYRWKKIYEIHGKKVGKLIPCSTAPSHVRRMHTDWRLVEFIKTMRQEYGNVGKNIIKPFLDIYAESLGIPSVGFSTIGKIIKRRHFTFEERVKVNRRLKFKKLRTRKSPRVTHPGFCQMDSIVVYVNKERHLFMSIIDIYTKYALVVLVPSLSSKQATLVFQQFQQDNPTSVQTVQTDNGSEFLAGFHEYLEVTGIRHQFIYPNMPRINGCIERFNRTIQEECILRNDEIYYDLAAFQGKLVHYLYWYNTKRPHSALSYMAPLTFIQTLNPKGA
jgi:transposase InsO family protein